jgi:hypothetical protein
VGAYSCPAQHTKNEAKGKSLQIRISMKRTWLWCLIAVVSVGNAAWSSDAKGGTEKAVAALEQQWLQSQQANNSDLVAPLLADKFTSTGSDGKVTNKAGSLATAKATNIPASITTT